MMKRSLVPVLFLFFLACDPEAPKAQVGPPGNPGPSPGDELEPTAMPVQGRSLQDRIRQIAAMPDLRADFLAKNAVGKAVAVAPDRQPFSASCWPMAQNGIDRRWQGSMVPAPAEKYATLFLSRDDGTRLVSWVQSNQGTDVKGLQPWEGICQGWVASAILEPAPGSAVSVRVATQRSKKALVRCNGKERGRMANCVSFTRDDIAALLAEAYSKPGAMALGTRCANPQVAFGYDQNGHIAQPSMCQNNAGTLFVLLTNFLGRARLPFAVMNADNMPVWTQPVWGYKLTRYDMIDAKTAAQFVGGPGKTIYDYNSNAKNFRHVTLDVLLAADQQPLPNPATRISATRSYDLILELDDKKQVLGGQWLGAGRDDHPQGYWIPTGPGTGAPGLNYNNVKALLAHSRQR